MYVDAHHSFPLPSKGQHLSYDVRLEVKRKQNSYVYDSNVRNDQHACERFLQLNFCTS